MAMTKWTPTTNLMMLRRMGKMLEELGELTEVAARCIIQGIDSFFWQYKTPIEKEFQRQILEERKAKKGRTLQPSKMTKGESDDQAT